VKFTIVFDKYVEKSMIAMTVFGIVAEVFDQRSEGAGAAFDLQGGVGDAVALQQEVFDLVQHVGRALAVVGIDIHMGRERPDV